MTKKTFEILYNLIILCFIDINEIKDQFKIIKEKICMNSSQKKLIKYFEIIWIKKPEIDNYSSLIADIIKCKNYYINNNGNKTSEKAFLSKLNS